MRLEHICIHNYRLYHHIDMDFPRKDQDMHIIVGDNGVGKTTFLNSINWCLYGDEPHAFSKESSLPIPNLESSDDDAYVELTVSSDSGHTIIFKRTYISEKNSDLLVSVKSPTGETDYFSGEQADIEVDRFVPMAIREFFFFDGEQLDTYFTSDRTKNIENRIFILSHIELIDQMIERLTEKRREFNKEASKLNKDVEPKRLELERKEKALEKEKKRLKELQKSKRDAEDRIKELDTELKGIPDVIDLEKRRDDLKKKISDLEEKISGKLEEITELVLLTAPSVFSFEAIEFTLEDIDLKYKNEQLPPQIDENVINESLDDGVCRLCNRQLDEDSIEYLTKTLNDYNLSSKQSKLLINLKSPLSLLENELKTFSKRRENLNSVLMAYRKSLKEYNDELNIVKELYAGYEDDSIKEKFAEREQQETVKQKCLIQIGSAQKNISNLEKEVVNLNDEIDEILSNNKKTILINKKKQLCDNSLKLLNRTKEDIMLSTKKQIGKYTKNKFFELIWKQDTFADVTIDDAYNVKLIHNITNSNCLGTASAAERELLALAFTLGIHSVSGFSSPLLIDTPLARVSGAHRVNFTNVLLDVSNEKQTILILTPDEFSIDVRNLIYGEQIQQFGIVQIDELHSKMKEMTKKDMEEFIEMLRRKSDDSR